MQLITVCARQVFDLLGFQWTGVTANFCQITVLILALLGAYRYKRRNVAVYSAWTLFWTGWNIFLVCLYLNIGILDLEEHSVAVNLALVDSYSWFKNTTFSCDSTRETVTVPFNSSTSNGSGCIIDFRYVEVIQAGFQIMLACFGFVISCYLIGVLEDETTKVTYATSEPRKHNGVEDLPLVRGRYVSEA